jgi:hypothetical protein
MSAAWATDPHAIASNNNPIRFRIGTSLRRHCRAPVLDLIGDGPAIHRFLARHFRGEGRPFTLMDARIKSGHDELDLFPTAPNNKNCGHSFPSSRSPCLFSRYFLL